MKLFKRLLTGTAALAMVMACASPALAKEYTLQDVQKAVQGAADRREAAYAKSVKEYQKSIAKRENDYYASIIAQYNAMYR